MKSVILFLLSLASAAAYTAEPTHELPKQQVQSEFVKTLINMMNDHTEMIDSNTIERYLHVKVLPNTNKPRTPEGLLEGFQKEAPRFYLALNSGYLILLFDDPTIALQNTSGPEQGSEHCVAAADIVEGLKSKWNISSEHGTLGYSGKLLQNNGKHMILNFYQRTGCLREITYWNVNERK